MHILFAGGGTAGHINPALAIAGYLKQRDPQLKISYVGTPNKLEATLVPAAGYDFYPIETSGFQRKLSFAALRANLKAVRQALTGSAKARRLLKRLRPDIVVGTGGYVSGPVVREAARLGIKTAIHEQNAFPGVTNKMLAKYVDRVMLAMPQAEGLMGVKRRYDVTGNPVRGELLCMDRQTARAQLGFDERPVLLSFGGSLGARPINEAIAGLLKNRGQDQDYYHIHAAGKAGYDTMLTHLKGTALPPTVQVRPYIDDMNVCLAAADLVICRAGAITLSELALCGKPAILIPSPYVAENHQYHNAMTLQTAGAAVVIEEKDLTVDTLCSTVNRLIGDPARLTMMAKAAKTCAFPDCLERIAAVIDELYRSI